MAIDIVTVPPVRFLFLIAALIAAIIATIVANTRAVTVESGIPDTGAVLPSLWITVLIIQTSGVEVRAAIATAAATAV